MEVIVEILLLILVIIIIILSVIITKNTKKSQSRIISHTTLEKFQAIGQLKVFKVLTKEIVTSKDHWAGEFGKNYLRWLWREKKIAMIFEYEIEFIYDLGDTEFNIVKIDSNTYKVNMPKCLSVINLKNIQIYDEQASRFLPWLLPEVIGEVFGDGFSADDKNRLIKEAENHTRELASSLTENLKTDVQASAKHTLESIARGFEIGKMICEFRHGIQITDENDKNDVI